MPAGIRETVELEHPQRQSEASRVRLILRRGLAGNCHRKLGPKFSSLFNVCAVSLSAECEREDAALELDVFVGGCKPRLHVDSFSPVFTNPLHCRPVTFHSFTRLYRLSDKFLSTMAHNDQPNGLIGNTAREYHQVSGA